MRVLLVTDDDLQGGTAHVALQVALGLKPHLDVELAYNMLASNEAFFRPARDAGIRLWNSKVRESNRRHSTYGTYDASKLLIEASPDLLLFVDAGIVSSHLALKGEAVARNIPFVTVVNALPDRTRILVAEFVAASITMLQKAERIVFVSDANRLRFAEIFPEVESPVSTIWNCCGAEYFELLNEESRRKIRADIGARLEDLLCLIVGRLERDKGQHLCLQALDILNGHRNLDGIKLVLAGSGTEAYVTEFKAEIGRLGLDRHVVVLGQRTDVLALLDASDLFVLPSYMEGMPISILEAMAKGLPIVASRIDGIPEQIDASCGFLIPPPTSGEPACVEALSERIVELKRQPDQRREMGAASRARAGALFRPDIMTSRYLELVSSIPGRRPRNLGLSGLIRSGCAIDVQRPEQAWNYLEAGWSAIEPGGIWSEGSSSTIHLPFTDDMRLARIIVRVDPFIPREGWARETDVFANERRLGTWRIEERGYQELSLVLNLAMTGRDVTLRLEHRQPMSPRSVGLGNDERPLSLCLQMIHVEEAGDAISGRPFSNGSCGWIEGTSAIHSLRIPRPLGPGSSIQFGQLGRGRDYLRNGWSGSEPEGTWTEGKIASILLPFQSDCLGAVRLAIALTPFLPADTSEQITDVFANDVAIGRWRTVRRGRNELAINLNLRRLGSRVLLRFELRNPRSPAAAGTAEGDTRLLALQFHTMGIACHRPTIRSRARALFRAGWLEAS